MSKSLIVGYDDCESMHKGYERGDYFYFPEIKYTHEPQIRALVG